MFLNPKDFVSFTLDQGNTPASSAKIINRCNIPMIYVVKTNRPKSYNVKEPKGIVGQ